MPRTVPACVLLAAATFLGGDEPRRSPAADPPHEPLVEQVRAAIERGVQFLRREEAGRGHWETSIGAAGKPGGYTCLAMLALLNCGVKPTDPLIQRGLD